MAKGRDQAIVPMGGVFRQRLFEGVEVAGGIVDAQSGCREAVLEPREGAVEASQQGAGFPGLVVFSRAFRQVPGTWVITRQIPSSSTHKTPSRDGTSVGVSRPEWARCRVTAAMSSLTAGGKIALTRWSTSFLPPDDTISQV